MLLIRAKLVSIKKGERNYLVLEGSYYSRTLEKEIPSAVSVMLDEGSLSRLSDFSALVGSEVEIPVKALVSKEKKRLFYVTNY